jgi:nitroreductase
MDVMEAIRRRRSVRSFSDKNIPQELVDRLVEAGYAAPHAGGLRSQEIIVSKDTTKLAEIAGQSFIGEAPIALVVLTDEEKVAANYGERGRMYAVCDAAASVQNILIAATSLGLGSCWVGAFDDNKLKKFLGTEKKPVVIVPVGFEG